jgi:hypothetical protein
MCLLMAKSLFYISELVMGVFDLDGSNSLRPSSTDATSQKLVYNSVLNACRKHGLLRSTDFHSNDLPACDHQKNEEEKDQNSSQDPSADFVEEAFMNTNALMLAVVVASP